MHAGPSRIEICLIRSMYSEHNNHTEALIMYGTGKIFRGRPTLGAWVTYALGTKRTRRSAGLHRASRPGRLQHQRHIELGQRLTLSALYAGTGVQYAGNPGAEPEPGASSPGWPAARQTGAALRKLNEEHRSRLSSRYGS